MLQGDPRWHAKERPGLLFSAPKARLAHQDHSTRQTAKAGPHQPPVSRFQGRRSHAWFWIMWRCLNVHTPAGPLPSKRGRRKFTSMPGQAPHMWDLTPHVLTTKRPWPVHFLANFGRDFHYAGVSSFPWDIPEGDSRISFLNLWVCWSIHSPPFLSSSGGYLRASCLNWETGLVYWISWGCKVRWARGVLRWYRGKVRA